MHNQSSTADVEIVYPEPMQELDESTHHDSITLTRALNEVIRELNRLKK